MRLSRSQKQMHISFSFKQHGHIPICQIDAVYKIQNTYDVIWDLTPTYSGAHEAIERDRLSFDPIMSF